jgi:hypothetical protein
MQSVWRKHLVICLFLGVLAIPIYFLDLASTGGGGGNWITLDFRGLIFWTYIALLVIDVALSSIALLSFPKSGVFCIHFWSLLLSVILLVAGFVFYGKLLRAQAISSGSGEKISPLGAISLARAHLEFSTTITASIPIRNKAASARVIVGRVFKGQVIAVGVGGPLHPNR